MPLPQKITNIFFSYMYLNIKKPGQLLNCCLISKAIDPVTGMALLHAAMEPV